MDYVASDLMEKGAQEKEVFNLLFIEAAKGSAEAQFTLGSKYDDGQGVSQNKKEALRWYQLAATQNHTKAQFTLGQIFHYGMFGLVQNKTEALRLYQLAAKQGLAEAQFMIGLQYDQGDLLPQNDVQAFSWYTLAAKQGLSEAQFALGEMYDYGQGVAYDAALALKWYKRAATQSHAEALFKLGEIHHYDEIKSKAYYKKAAKEGHAGAQYKLDYISTEEAAEKGVLEAQREIMWVDDIETKEDLTHIYQRRFAAANGDTEAMFELAEIYYDMWERKSIESGRDMAAFWYAEAAARGYADAQYEFAYRIHLDEFMSEFIDKETACYWLKMAVAQGHEKAQDCLEGLLNEIQEEKSKIATQKEYEKSAYRPDDYL
jgi:TPR repeat protein